MNFDEYLAKADEYIRIVSSDSKEPTNKVKLDTYAKLFDLLLIDSEEDDNIFNHIDEARPEQVYTYVQKLYILNRLIVELPDTDPHKELLQERLLNNINLTAFDKFQHTFETNPQLAVTNFVKAHTPEPVAGTVEVRTWGTDQQMGSGLKGTIDKKLRGDDVGHAALVMTVAADDKGLELINKYCLDEDGLVKIPFELKKIGGETVYEIYWSYWPGRLNTMEGDFQKERGGLEYRDVAELERSVPRELSENYIIHKLRGSKEISLASASERATSREMQTSSRAQFLRKQDAIAKLEEELESLDVLKSNYLAAGKEFSPEATAAKIDIKKTSNFLTLLARFKKELGEDKTIAKILTEKKISSSESDALIKAIDKLVKSKQDKSKELTDECKTILQKNHLLHKSEQKLDEVTKEQRDLLKIKDNLKRITPISEHLKSILDKNPTKFPIVLSQKMVRALDKADWHITNANGGDKLIYKVVKAKGISDASELAELIKQLDKCKQGHVTQLDTQNKGKELRTELQELQGKYQKGRKYFIDVVTTKIEAVNTKLETTVEPGARLKLERQKEQLEEQLLKVKICSTYDYRDLRDKKLRRGIPYQSNVLKGFDIESMLHEASMQAGKTDDFKLKEENCSTTSMRLLEKGAPEQFKILFKSSKPPVKPEYEFQLEAPPEVMEDNTIYLTAKNGHLAYSMKAKDGTVIKEQEISKSTVKEGLVDFKLTEAVKKQIVSIATSYGHAPEIIYDSEAFLTNPQAVHSASKLFKQVEHGGPQATETLDKLAQEQRSKSSYYKVMNELADIDDRQLGKLKNKEAGALWSVIKKFILSPSALINFVKEFFFPPKEKTIVAVDSMLGDMKSAIEQLNNGKFLYIQTETPYAALSEMLHKLQESPTAIPFFKNNTLDKIRNVALAIESKDNKTDADNLFIDTYNKVMHERNNRMATVEDALATGVDVKAKLLANKNSVADLDFQLSPEQLAEHQVTLYEQAFKQKRSESYLPSVLFDRKHSFIGKLNQYGSYEEKLSAIQAHIEKDPSSMSAAIMKEIQSTDHVSSKIAKEKLNPSGHYSAMLHSLGADKPEPTQAQVDPKPVQSGVPSELGEQQPLVEEEVEERRLTM